jgi:anti-sigma B factor antagonist
MATTRLAANIAHHDGHCTITLSGELDLAVANDIAALGKATVQTTEAHTVVLDLTSVTFLDSTAIGAFITIRNAAEVRGLTTSIIGASSRIVRSLTITGLTGAFDIK